MTASSVVVTGASRGLGLAIAERLVREGRDVIAVSRQPSEALQTLETAGLPGRLRWVGCDLSRTDELPAWAGHLRRTMGPIGGLVNNAGLGTAGILATMRDADIESLVRLNVLSPILLTRHLVGPMLAAGRGRIVQIASITASTGYAGLSVYSASKAALIGFTRSLAREVGPAGITVNAIAPGFIETDMTASLDAGQLSQVARRSALRRLATADDVAQAVSFLLSEAAANITGSVLTVDAGATA